MARSRRALLRKGNVTNIADARKKREEKQQASDDALANSRLSTLEEVSATQQTVDPLEASANQEASATPPVLASQQSLEPEALRENAGMSRASGQFSGFDLNDVRSYTISDPARPSGGGTTPESPGDSIRQSEGGTTNGASGAAAETDSTSSQPAAKVSNRRFNREKVDAIKKAIANGSYQINPQRIADKFIEREAPA